MKQWVKIMRQTLWTKNFTIITLGTIVSMLGVSISQFALSLAAFDTTQSTFLFALVSLAAILPSLVIPNVAGPLLDRFSRRKTIYTLDFICCLGYALMAVALYMEIYNVGLFLLFSFISGCIGSAYNVAYESFYPNLISEGNMAKAYSISSMIYPLCNTVMVPIAAITIKTYGMGILFVFASIASFIAAIFEMQIVFQEDYVQKEQKKYSKNQFWTDFKDGIQYLKGEKALLGVCQYFVVSNFVSAAIMTLMLPFFSTTPGHSVEQYAVLMSLNTAGRLIGAGIHYVFRYPPHIKFTISVSVYILTGFLNSALFFTPFGIMCLIQFISGVLSVTSFSIRTSATQSYVDDSKRARFNATFLMLTFTGSAFGQLIFGFAAEFIDIRTLIVAAGVIGIFFAYSIMIRKAKTIAPLYNREI